MVGRKWKENESWTESEWKGGPEMSENEMGEEE